MKKLNRAFLGIAASACLAVSVGLLAACADEPAAHTHDYGDWTITEPTESNTGYAVKTCGADGCDQKTVTVTLPVLGDASYTKTNDTATCEDGGTASYSYAKDGETFTFTAATPATGHVDLFKTDEDPKGCTKDGTEAYWTCVCGLMFSDENAEHEIDEPVVIPASHEETLWHEAAKAATCAAGGTVEYWVCDCGQKFSDEDGEHEIADVQTTEIDPDAHLPLEYRGEVAKTCTRVGAEEYWYCPGCLQKYSDEEGEHEIANATPISASHAEVLTHVDAVAATCTKEGVAEYWYCPDCNQKFSDADGSLVSRIIKPATTSKVAHTPGAVISGSTYDGGFVTVPEGTKISQTNNLDYYVCEGCDAMFADEACTKEITNPSARIGAGRGAGTILGLGNNLFYMGTVANNAQTYFQATEDGCYAFVMNNSTMNKIGYFAEAADGKTLGISAYNYDSTSKVGTWDTSSKYLTGDNNRFSKNDTTTTLGSVLYIDMKEGDVVMLHFGFTAGTVFGVNITKMAGENALILGANTVTVGESDVEGGVERTFTASKDSLYKITVPTTSKAYVWTTSEYESVLSAEEGKTSYVFTLAAGESITFHMSAADGAATYTATIAETEAEAETPKHILGLTETVPFQNGFFSYEFTINVDEAGEYYLVLDCRGRIATMGRNWYDVYVNGVKVLQIGPRTTAQNEDYYAVTYGLGQVWREVIELAEGSNTIEIKNAMPQNGAVPQGVPITVEEI